jgi:hypothetical protein
MKRFSFFLAVFSVGLLLFLLLTGQFGKLFQGRASDGEGVPIGGPDRPGDGERRITHHKHDYDRGRLQFTLKGVLEGEADYLMSMTQNMDQERTLRDAIVEVPLYPAGENVSTPEDIFTLQAGRVRIIPGKDGGSDEVILEGKIHGEGQQGHPRFDTEGARLTWADGGTAHLIGDQRVQIEYPAVTLRGQRGFEATIDGREGLSDIRILPPLVVALSPDAEGSILGFRGGALLADETGEEERSRVHLFSRGPMTIDTETGTAIFEGPVQIYQVSVDTSLEPPDPNDIPENRFVCEKLRLELDSLTRRVTRLIAEKVNDPVQVHLAEGYRVEGNKLVWSDGEQEAVLSGDVRILGDLGEFRAESARILPDEGLCWLVGGIEARMRGDALVDRGSGDGEWDQRIDSEWILVGDRAELRYTRGAKGQQLESFHAYALPGERVTIREDREGGALLLGGEMVYDPERGVVRVLAGDEPGALQPDFHEGRNRVRAARIDLGLTRPELVFEGDVDGTLVDPPVDAEGSWPAWLEPGDSSSIRLLAEKVRLSWDENDRLQRIEAWRGAEPLFLDHRSDESFQLHADAIDWNGTTGEIRAFGDGRQTLTFVERAEISARALVFSVVTWVARGDGEVVTTAVRPPPRDAAGPALRPVTIEGDHVEISLRPPSDDNSQDGEIEPRENAGNAGTEGTDPLRSGQILSARGWSDTPGTLEIEEGSIHAIGDELLWDAVEGVIRLLGDGRQRVIYRSPDGLNELSAESIEYHSDERRLILLGESRARLHQGMVPSGSEPSEDANEHATLPWEFTAGSLEVFFREKERDSDDGSITLDRIVAGDRVNLTQEESEIELQGEAAEWDAITERLRVYSPEGEGLQTLYRGVGERDEIVAREFLLLRPAAGRKNSSERIEVLFLDVLRASIHFDEGGEDDPQRPDVFRMVADNLLLGISGTREEIAPGVSPMPIDEARAWGNVDFRGGDYRIVSHRALFRRRARTILFEGRGRQKVQILLQGQASLPASKRMELKWRPGVGYEVNDRPAGGQWSVRNIEEVLEMFDREDRAEPGGRD